MHQTISIIVAIAQNNVIGANNRLIWHISDDLKRFKALTTGHHVIMGRKTYESIGKPLPNRVNIVVSRDPLYKADGCIVVSSLEKALENSKNDSEVFIIGGGELYRQALPLSGKLYLTRVHGDFEGDTFFPEIDETQWREVYREDGKPTAEGQPAYTFIDLERK
ncbi:MAG TPA: dihydrofolate reductase [Tenuifilaceae bacterium]|nr:dihydrofolate reductase [Tenuifilaceae bacterium]